VYQSLSAPELRALLQLGVMNAPIPRDMWRSLGISESTVLSLRAASLIVERADGCLQVDDTVAHSVLGRASAGRIGKAHLRAATYFAEATRTIDRTLVDARNRKASETWCRYLYHLFNAQLSEPAKQVWVDFAWLMRTLAGGEPLAWRLRVARAAEQTLSQRAIRGSVTAAAACSAGAALHDLGDHTRGVELCLAGIASTCGKAETSCSTECLLISAECLMDHGRAVEVENLCRAALIADLETPLTAEIYLWLGKALYRQGRLEEALSAYRSAERLTADLRPAERAALSGFVSNVLMDQGKPKYAFVAAMNALRLARTPLNEQEVATQMVNLALISRRLGRQLESDRLCDDAAKIYKRLGYQRGLGTTWRIRANSSRGQGEVRAALTEIKKSLACHTAAGYTRGQAMSSGVAAEIATDARRWKLAERYYGRAVTLAREIGDDRTLAINLLGVGSLLASKPGRLEEAQQLLIEAHATALRRGLVRVRTKAESALNGFSGIPAISDCSGATSQAETEGVAEQAILLVATTDVEMKALHTALAERGLRHYEYDAIAGYARVGVLTSGRAICTLRLVQMGSGGAGGALLSIHEAAKTLGRPTVILVGIAFGVDERTQKIGDILVANRLVMYEQLKIGTHEGGALDIQWRGQRVDAHPRPLRAFHAVAHRRKTRRVHFGPMLTGEKLIDNLDYRRSLESISSGVIGGEMEAAGLYSAAAYSGLEWGCVKAICDFADGKKRIDKARRQARAARNASQFVAWSLDSL
jgi:nucleoside phosphorylase